MCDEKGCSPDEKAACLAHFGPDGKFIVSAKECKKEGDCCKKK
jgi:K(+)-stimulated pyrophosphate-energized sodium pump